MTLATIDERVPSGNYGNNPSRSLMEIFMPWSPQTAAPVEERVKVLQKLAKDRPQAGWRLLIGLLPIPGQISMPTSRPSWRDWALTSSNEVSNADYWYQASASADVLIEQLAQDVARWESLINHLGIGRG
jgi:hypothetical protein